MLYHEMIQQLVTEWTSALVLWASRGEAAVWQFQYLFIYLFYFKTNATMLQYVRKTVT